MNRALRRASWRYLLRHFDTTLLMILGIALGVAVVVAVDVANTSAARAFDLSVDAVTGRATHQIVGGPRGLDETVYTRLRVEGGIQQAAPVVSDYFVSPQLGNRPIQLLGIDPFADWQFRSYGLSAPGAGLAATVEGPVTPAQSGPPGANVPTGQTWSAFLTRPGALLLSDGLAARYGLRVGQTLALQIGGQRSTAFVAGLLHPADPLDRQALDGVALADIATAQELTGRTGRLDRIDLILPAGDAAAMQAVQRLLPPDAQLVPAGPRTAAVEQMTAAFRLNLTALSLLALVVGMFLIYNSMTFSVVQRRPLFGTLRCLGATRQDIGRLVLNEAFVAGLLGSALGLGLGALMGRWAVQLVTQTINDLYYVVNVRDVAIPGTSLVKGAMLGVSATVLSAALPAWEAGSVPPRLALSRSDMEDRARQAVPATALAGAAGLLAGGGVLAIPTRSVLAGFAGIFLIAAGFALLAPLVTLSFLRLAGPLTGRAFGVLGRMAPRSVTRSLSRTAVAIAALMMAVSVTLGVGLMVGSFRATVVDWLGQTLDGDIYISAPSFLATRPSNPLDPDVIDVAAGWPGVSGVQKVRSSSVLSPAGPIAISAVSAPDITGNRIYISTDAGPAGLGAAVKAGAVLVSEPLANRLRLPAHGASISLATEHGPHSFPVAGIYRDYTSSQGVVTLDAGTYHSYWDDPVWTSVSLTLAPGVDAGRVAAALQAALNRRQAVVVQTNSRLRADVLQVFDRAFAITDALQLLAAAVAFIGVLSALLALQLERARETGVLRAIGLTARQLFGAVLLETGLMGTVAGLLAWPSGLAMALVLSYIINRRSFGWTLEFHAAPGIFLQALLLAVAAALLAGIYPAWRMARAVIAEAVRGE